MLGLRLQLPHRLTGAWAKPQKHPRNFQKTADRRPVIPANWESYQLGCGPNPTSLGPAPVIRALTGLIFKVLFAGARSHM